MILMDTNEWYHCDDCKPAVSDAPDGWIWMWHVTWSTPHKVEYPYSAMRLVADAKSWWWSFPFPTPPQLTPAMKSVAISQHSKPAGCHL